MRWVITGTNRGIGLELVRQLVERGDHVDATVRDLDRAGELMNMRDRSQDRLRVIKCDISDDASVRALADAVGEIGVDVVINNAGVSGKMQSLEDLDLHDVIRTFDINALGAVRVTRALLPHLQRCDNPRVVSITSGMGSISDNQSGGAYAYRMSKAALNMANRSMSVDLRGRGITCVVINPGWVQTDMGGRHAPMPVQESASKMITIFAGLSLEQTGAFLDVKGTTWEY